MAETEVAQHYNKLEETGLVKRAESQIFYLRNFNNWIKSMLINEFLERVRQRRKQIRVLDLCSGKGGDLRKWKIAGVKQVVCADIAEVSVEQCETRYKEMGQKSRPNDRLFDAEFIAADCTKNRLKDLYKSETQQFDLVSCQFSFHYCFESYEQADLMLRNAAECLSVGGFFIGTTPNSHEILKRLRASSDGESGNSIYKISSEFADQPPLFGAKYHFYLEGVVNCPEYLVYFDLLEKMGEKYGLQIVKRMPFHAFFKERVKSAEGRPLLRRMQALEPFPTESQTSGEKTYTQSQQKFEKLKEQSHCGDSQSHQRNRPSVGTLSQEEWEATTIYMVFAFKKVEDIAPPFEPTT